MRPVRSFTGTWDLTGLQQESPTRVQCWPLEVDRDSCPFLRTQALTRGQGALIGSKVRASGLGRCADGAAAPSDSGRCGLPHEPVRVGEGPDIAAHREPVRSGAVGRDAGELGEGTAV
jgi:hypothetical protein